MRGWIITGIVVAAVGALVAYIATHTYFDSVPVPTPLRGEAVTNPFYAR